MSKQRVTYIDIAPGEETTQRYDIDPIQNTPHGREQLDYGGIPLRIPRLWSMGLAMMAGIQSWGLRDVWHSIRLSPPVIVPPTRTSPRAIAGAMGPFGAAGYNDTTRVPAVFVGNNPESSVQ